MIKALEIFAGPAFILAAFIWIRVFVMPWKELNLLICMCFIFCAQSIFTVLINLGEILRAQAISQSHTGKLQGLRNMVEWTISNEDDDSAAITLQELIYDEAMDSNEIRKQARMFLQNLNKVIGLTQEQQFHGFQFFGFQLTPNLYGVIQTYVAGLVAPLFAELGKAILKQLGTIEY